MNSPQNFFDTIGIADRERMHSSVIGWLLSDECDVLTQKERSMILNQIFGIELSIHYTKIKAQIEFDSIDITWLVETPGKKRYCLSIENKIKSRQHSDQLTKYEQTQKERFPHYELRFVLLSLIGEKPNSQQYGSCTYAQLVSLLQPYFKKESTNPHYIIAKEYFNSIQKMASVTQDFLQNPEKYPNVFINGAVKKGDKPKYEDPNMEYVSRNGFETIFQCFYFSKLADSLFERFKNSPQYKDVFFANYKNESRGNAEICLAFHQIGTKEFDFDVAFQGGTFKFAVSKHYFDTGRNQNKNHTAVEKNWENIFKDHLKPFSIEQGWEYNRCNKSKKRARISLTRDMDKIQPEWYKKSQREFENLLFEEFCHGIQLWEKALELHNSLKPSPQ